MTRAHVWGFALLMVCSGCALRARHSRSNVDATRVARAEELQAKRRAPLAYERYEAARRAAERSARDGAEHGDRATEARLWLEVALAEAERQALSEQRLEEERALVGLDAELVRLTRERAARAAENELAAAQALARGEAERALARAAQRPETRVRLPREEVKRAAEALTTRAELIALTLVELGKQSPALGRLQKKLGEARALLAKEPDAALTRADEALFDALSLLAVLRAGQPAPSLEEKDALVEELALAGLRVGRGDGGLSGLLEQPFAQSALKADAARVLARLCALAKAHPHGAVQLTVRGAHAQPRLVAARERLRAEGCGGERFVFTAQEGSSDLLEATFLAY